MSTKNIQCSKLPVANSPLATNFSRWRPPTCDLVAKKRKKKNRAGAILSQKKAGGSGSSQEHSFFRSSASLRSSTTRIAKLPHACAPLYEQLNIATPLKRFEYKLIYFTYRCTHSLASTLLVNQYKILSQSKARTSSITRGQSSVKLALCNVKTRSGSVSSLFTSSLLWNSLPSALRQPDLSSSQFSHLLYLYLGFPVNRHF